MTQENQTGILPDGGRLLPVLSERQAACLSFVYHFAVEHRDYPLGTEIASHLNITKQAVAPLLTALTKKGYLFRDRNLAQRNIRLTQEAVEKIGRELGVVPTPDLFTSAVAQ